ncbi:SGNH/GDSL hydrolase family protein [Parasedimentitalea psychrophila]|uniref:SGNH/GDSL hydrolase family protein n=1 Tax=Parasedimentitalea psychrophila TaxID=2997337 RepID=A0A9Y2L314_9RHOB|nr:SGNH/GDSL hydrolase family protein [Parasedimentitalea psychrophila]WIY26467.1 SGNH/GDSL hydrolase family protein [Parasedimentitalea psychrophila]
MRFLAHLLAVTALITGCSGAIPKDQPSRILAMGDSLMAWNSNSGQSIPDMVADTLGEPVEDRSVSAARVIYNLPISGSAGLNIRKQYRPGDWDWIIVNGGGNDLLLGCGCFACDRKLDKLVSDDGRKGAIPGMLSQLRQTGARIIYVGYLRSPGVGSAIEHCRSEGDILEQRVARLADLDNDIYFLSLRDLVPHGDRSYHAVDMIHPSVKASSAIGTRIAQIIQSQ